MEKPTSLIIEETKETIANALNNSHLHPYIMDSIMKDLYEQVHTLYIQTVQKEEAEYKKSLKQNDKESKETAEK